MPNIPTGFRPMNFDSYPLWINLLIFFAAAGAIALGGSRLAEYGDRLADRTGLGEALTGTIFLGLITALPGLAASVTAALDGHPGLAISNAIGGIAIQTTFLAVADLVYTKANLEHAAASVANMIQTALLLVLLALTLLGLSGPDVSMHHVHPITPLLFVAAGFGIMLVNRSRKKPMWQPERTVETVPDIPEPGAGSENLPKLLALLFTCGALVTASGTVVARSTAVIAVQTGLSETVVGALLTGTATSLPELATTVAAVRRGALTLAVSDIVGGNFFDILFVFAADLFYFTGSIYHAPGVGNGERFLTALTILLNIVFLLGLLYRQRRGPANIGFESVLMLLIYLGGIVTMVVFM
jgi:cation:H+ antiporter